MNTYDNYEVAIDILRCHLGMTTDEAMKELGLDNSQQVMPPYNEEEIRRGMQLR